MLRRFLDRRPREVPSPDQPRDLVLYQFTACPFCQRVLRALDELGMTVPLKDTMADPEARAELLAATGGTQVPCLIIDGQPLLESRDIVEWLRSYHAAGKS